MAGGTAYGQLDYRGIYFAKESNWGTKITAETAGVWYYARVLNFNFPDLAKTRDYRGIVGDGNASPDKNLVTTGHDGMSAFSTNHPLTLKNSGWFFGSLANGNAVNTDAGWAVHTSATPNTIATLLAMEQVGGPTFYGTSCNVSQISLTIPQSEGGGTGGQCSMDVTWVGQKGEGDQAAQTVHATHAADDDGAQLITKDMTFKTAAVGGTTAAVAGFISGSMNFTNGYMLHPATAPDGLPAGARYGAANVTGDVSVVAGSAADTALRAAFEADTHTLIEFYWAASNLYRIPCFIGTPSKTEVSGVVVWSYPYAYAVDNDEAETDGSSWYHINSSADGSMWDVDA